MNISKSNFLRSLTFVIICIAVGYTIHLQGTPDSKNDVKTIVLDAGHGGKDPGAIGKMSYEKDINLQVTLKLGRMIAMKYPDKKVIFTRTGDTYPGLKTRHEIANRANGDVFISIHVNSTSAKTTSRSGTESYILGLHRNDQKEDAIVEFQDMIVDENGMLDPSNPLTAIIIAQYSQAYLSRSINLASYIEKEFQMIGRRSEGVKQKGLEVLAGSAMPGVLVELGFINNPSDEAYLTSDYGQTESAQAILRGVEKYITSGQVSKYK